MNEECYVRWAEGAIGELFGIQGPSYPTQWRLIADPRSTYQSKRAGIRALLTGSNMERLDHVATDGDQDAALRLRRVGCVTKRRDVISARRRSDSEKDKATKYVRVSRKRGV